MILSLVPAAARPVPVDHGRPEDARLSVCAGIRICSRIVINPKKAVSRSNGRLREMEDRYKKMPKLGVRNIDGYSCARRSQGPG